MLLRTRKSVSLFVSVVFSLLALLPVSCGKAEKISSSFGRYGSPVKILYPERKRTSLYVEMSDGVKLAVDLILPARDGREVKKKFPCIWTHARYHRARLQDGKVISMVDRSESLQDLVRHGYVVAAVDVRGGGASFGRYLGVFSPRETRDAYEITEWLAQQPWCDGNIGMYGASYLGITQFRAASAAPPHLKAIFPSMAGFDMFTFMRNGGIFRQGFVRMWGDLTRKLDTQVPPVPVDSDIKGEMAARAVQQHQNNWDVYEEAYKSRFRDGKNWQQEFEPGNPSASVEAVNASGVAVYIWSGIFDIWARDAFQWFANLKVPKKLTIGTWPHNVWTEKTDRENDRLIQVERLRWYDYWLKGIDNGVMDEPAIHYGILEKPDQWRWRKADTWPVPESAEERFNFQRGPAGSVPSVNDGMLSRQAPEEKEYYDSYQADFTVTSGSATRWSNAAGIRMKYPDLSAMDAGGLTYTTAALKRDITVVGHPLVHLFVESDQPDGDFYVFLEEIDPQNVSHYVTEGWLRASCRFRSKAPYDNLGLPYFPVSGNQIQKLAKNEIVELVFDLHPVSNVFNAGNRMRVTVVCADAGNSELYLENEKPVVRLHCGSAHSSHIVLPVLKN